jgi:hypothetical protein
VGYVAGRAWYLRNESGKLRFRSECWHHLP